MGTVITVVLVLVALGIILFFVRKVVGVIGSLVLLGIGVVVILVVVAALVGDGSEGSRVGLASVFHGLFGTLHWMWDFVESSL